MEYGNKLYTHSCTEKNFTEFKCVKTGKKKSKSKYEITNHWDKAKRGEMRLMHTIWDYNPLTTWSRSRNAYTHTFIALCFLLRFLKNMYECLPAFMYLPWVRVWSLQELEL